MQPSRACASRGRFRDGISGLTQSKLTVIGGGLAGCEAAWQLAKFGISVELLEMRPVRPTPVHTTDRLAELVCSNSLRGDSAKNAVGLLKHEMEALGSLIVSCARSASVPAGGALAVDRTVFSRAVQDQLESHPLVTVVRGEQSVVPDESAIIATGPLTSPLLHKSIEDQLGEGALSFFDAVAPIVAADSLDMTQLFRASRYDKGSGEDYLNAALNKAQYEAFIDALLAEERVPYRDFEEKDFQYFEGCLPIEVMAERGPDTLRYGPMKPVGLTDPKTGRRPWAVLQLRQDDLAAEHWNLVGFQTKLTQSGQKAVFRTVPGLENANFVRFGMIHRNTFINAPSQLDSTLRLTRSPHIRLAGQITGVEGYVESAATGLLAARMFAAEFNGVEPELPPPGTAHHGLLRHLAARPPQGFQPSNITWGLITCPQDLITIRNKGERREKQADVALAAIREWDRRTRPILD
ncbi:MAG: methylenetetrahydrofolate--tRNA-(uracil(54)-C(5))-methyltransferase (FADH(2)-oxidizing) TrmFO [bacterium]|nr:methylenetetrahydrofolate--tRNA-(uracil(54)-C(5))-methyltransferase (FADH(2)-oxidizing) TrmFO [bacterium]